MTRGCACVANNLLQLNNFRLAAHTEPVDLCFEPGQISVVLGRNNSGKTNLLRLIAGLETQAQADVMLNGKRLKALRTGERPVGYVFQAFVNYPHWTVRQNIESPMRSRAGGAKRLSRSDRSSRVSQIANTLQLTELLDRVPAELSGGQQQRLAIGRALASDAQILLLDEPFVNLDFRLRERLTEELGELLRNTDTMAVFASSDCRDAFALGDALILLADQEVLQSGLPIEIYQQPASLEAAHLMSEPAANWYALDSAPERNHFVVRPEHMKLAKARNSGGASQQYRLRVEGVETSGSHTYVQGTLEAFDCSSTSPRWVARLDGMPELTPYFCPESEHPTLVFDIDPRNLIELTGSSDRVRVNHGAA